MYFPQLKRKQSTYGIETIIHGYTSNASGNENLSTPNSAIILIIITVPSFYCYQFGREPNLLPFCHTIESVTVSQSG